MLLSLAVSSGACDDRGAPPSDENAREGGDGAGRDGSSPGDTDARDTRDGSSPGDTDARDTRDSSSPSDTDARDTRDSSVDETRRVGDATAEPAGEASVPHDCSETPVRTAPPADKLFLTVSTPHDAHFPFTQHWVGTFSDDPRFVSMTSLTDIDHDGDLDFACGQREDVGGGMNWFEQCGPDHWVEHHVGEGHRSAAGGGAFDVNGDGWVDLVASDSWYLNPQNPRATGRWQRYLLRANLRVEEVIIGDVNHDGHGDALFLMTGIEPQWWTPGQDATAPWTDGAEIGTTVPQMQRQGGAIGDIDGDGHNDVLAGNQWWYRNVIGDGHSWEAIHIDDGASFTNEPLTYLGDLDGDGDTDLQMVTHWGGDAGASIAWFENIDGKGRQFTMHMLATGKGWLHDVVAADFDNDGDLDIFVGKNVGEQWIWENDGKGHFVEHTVASDFRGHEARVGDVDCDGDLDIVGKPWGDPNEGGEGNNPPRDILYLKNEFVEKGGAPVFERPNQVTFQKTWPYVCKR